MGDKNNIATGLTDEDIDFIAGSGENLHSLKWTGGQKDLLFADVVGANGDRVAQQKAIKDKFGFFIRSDREHSGAGGYSINVSQADVNNEVNGNRKTTLMVSGSEFADAVSQLARTQYEVERDTYYHMAENYVMEKVIKEEKHTIRVDMREVLRDREDFHSGLLLKVQDHGPGNTNNIETEMYQYLLEDYYGKGRPEESLLGQVYGMELIQREAIQREEWKIKNQEFYRQKRHWIQTVSNIKRSGEEQWKHMVNEFMNERTKWRVDFEERRKAVEDQHLNHIGKTFEAKEAWTQNFLEKAKNAEDEVTLRTLYNGIANQIQGMQQNAPMGVAVKINPNEVLNAILRNKPKSTLSEYMKFAGKYADTNFFMREIKEYKFSDTDVMEKFKAANAERDKLSKNLVIMQALESLMGLPAAYSKQIEAANKGLEESLNWTMLQSQFFRVGDVYARMYTNHLGKTEKQILPAYPHFKLPPGFMKFPTIKSSDGTAYNMSDVDKLLTSESLGSGELQTMVNLARNVIDTEFKSTYYDPRVRVDYETALAIGTGGLDHLSQSAHAFIADANYTTCWAKSVEECGNSALKAGYLVGDVSGGEFGKHHFISFYTILKKKQDYDRKKGASQAVKERRKAGISNLHRDIATGYKLGQQSGQKSGLGHLGSEMAGVAGALGGLMFSLMSVTSDAFSELHTPGNPMEIALSQAHYKKNMYIDKNLGANDKYRVGKMTEAVAKGDAVTDTIITVGATVAAVAAVVIGAIVDIAAGGATLGAGIALGAAAAGSIMTGLAGYKAVRGMYEGGFAGAALQGGSAYLSAKLAGGALGSAFQGLTVDRVIT